MTVLLAVPGALMLFGERSVNLEGVAPPAIKPFKFGRLLDSRYYNEIQTWFSFAQPLRDNAITTNVRVDLTLLKDQPTPTVVAGSNGWYFTSGDTSLWACAPSTPSPTQLSEAIRQMRQRADLYARPLFVFVTPDKSPLEREHRDESDPDLGCILNHDRAVREAISGIGEPWVPDLWSVMDAVKQRHGSAFYKTDSHMAPNAEVALVRATVDAIQPGLWADSDVHTTGTINRPTDLSRQIGLPQIERTADIRAIRPGVTVSPPLDIVGVDAVPRNFVWYHASGPATIGGKTVILHDSQFVMAADQLAQFFDHVEFIHWSEWGDPRIAAELAGADRIIVQTVERAAAQRLVGPLPTLLQQALPDR